MDSRWDRDWQRASSTPSLPFATLQVLAGRTNRAHPSSEKAFETEVASRGSKCFTSAGGLTQSSSIGTDRVSH